MIDLMLQVFIVVRITTEVNMIHYLQCFSAYATCLICSSVKDKVRQVSSSASVPSSRLIICWIIVNKRLMSIKCGLNSLTLQ
mmetsp:Transcript_68055/g.110396  ORF Transcript_68055/g.110396 Transcript_68055/m.110396 type:complete len:82 (-) Transcript_68055:369-614(-)